MAGIARTETSVVLVRSGEQAAEGHEKDPAGIPAVATAYRPMVLGLDTGHTDGAVIAFAFGEATRRGTALNAVYGAHFVHGLPAARSPTPNWADREPPSRPR